MNRTKVDAGFAEQAVDAVCSNRMSYLSASHGFGVSVGLIQKRLNESVSMDGRVGPSTVLTPEDEHCLENNLKWAARRQLGVGRGNLMQAMVAI